MFKILDRYILRQIVLPFVLVLVVLTFALEIPAILRNGEDLVAKGVEWSIIARIFMTLLPSQLSLTIPMSLLIGILIGFGQLSADREFVALQACGVSLMRLFRPLAFIAIFATAFSAYETVVALPDANQTFREITYNVMASRVERDIKPGVFFEDFPNLVIFVRDLPPDGGWRDVFLADRTRPAETTVYFAREGRIRLDREQRLVQLELLEATSHTTYVGVPEKHSENAFASTVITLDPKMVFKDPPAKGAPEKTFAELRATIAELAAQGDPGYLARLMYQQKIALPMTCPILALIGLALGASTRKDGKLASFVLGFVVIFFYYLLLYSFRAVALGGRFSPEWAPWVPNIIMGAASVLLLARRERLADQPIRLNLPAFGRRNEGATATLSHPVPRRRIVLIPRVSQLNLPALRLLDRYVAKEYWRVVSVAVLSLLGIFYVSTLIDLAEKMLKGQAPVGVVLRFFYFQTPQFVFWVLPMAVLVATLVTMAVMTKNSELIIMRACGVSLYRTTAPLLVLALGASAVLFALQERVLPRANREADRLNRIIRGFEPQMSPFNQRWIIGRNGSIFNYDTFDSTASRFLHLRTYEVAPDSWRLGAMTYAADATLVRRSADDPTVSLWAGHQGWVRRFSAGSPKAGTHLLEYEPFTERQLTLESPEYFSSRPRDTDQMTYDQMLTFNELRSYIDQLRASGANVVPYVVALQRKIAFPLVTVLMTVLAVPFGVSGGRRGALYGVGIGLVLALGYFVTMSVFGAFGAGGILPPALAAWAANLLFGAAAVYMILTVRT